jgi:hypothetical protein
MAVPNTTYRVLVEKLGDSNPSQFIGNEGEVFYDPDGTPSPELKLSDGTTPGGVAFAATYATTSGISTSVIGGISSVSSLNVSGISTLSGNVSVGGTLIIKGFIESQNNATNTSNILSLNSSNGTVFTHTTTSQIGIVSFSGISTAQAGTQTFSVIITQGVTPVNVAATTGIGTQLATIVTDKGVGYSTHIKVGSGTTLTLTNSAGAIDLLTFIVSYDGNTSVANTSFRVIGFAATDFRGVI